MTSSWRSLHRDNAPRKSILMKHSADKYRPALSRLAIRGTTVQTVFQRLRPRRAFIRPMLIVDLATAAIIVSLIVIAAR